MMEWPSSIPSLDGGRIPIVKRDAGIRLSLVPAAHSLKRCVPHTTESSVRPAYASGVRPTFDVGPNIKGGKSSIVQYVPLGYAATALRNDPGGRETNREVLVQIEQIAFTAREPWLPPAQMVVQLASLAEFLEEELGIPQVYPYDAKDMASGIWATTSNPWRNAMTFYEKAGWHAHAAVPEGNHHWDCGGERISRILRMKPDEPEPKLIDAYQLMSAWHNKKTDHRESEWLSPHFASKSRARSYFVNHPGQMWGEIRKGRRIFLAHRRVDETKVKR